MRSQEHALQRLRRAAICGAFTVRMARDAGYSRAAIRHRQECGYWQPVVGKAYCDPRWAARFPALQTRAAAATLTWPGVVLCLRTAALLHGFRVPDDGRAHVITEGSRRTTGGVVPHRMGISPGEVTHRGPLAVTTRARTALDCLMDFPRSDAESLMIWVRTREVLTATDLEEAIAARQGHRGVSQLRSLTALTADGALSELEHRLHQLLREAGITGWIANAPVRVGGRIIARADVLFPAANVILEADGRKYHQDFEADRRRLNSLTLAGYVVLRLTWRQVTEDPQVVIQQVREALAS